MAARRVVILKVDGLGQDTLGRWLTRRNPETGRSALPWIHHVFIERGAYLKNFYVRGISLSVPSWSMLDTGRPSVIRGNAEFDRSTGHIYDYMNFFPFYFENARSNRADMPGVEVLDEAGIPLLLDSFSPSERLQGMQLFQRGIRWKTLKSMLPRRFSGGVRKLFDEWQTGFELTNAVGEQVEHDLVTALTGDTVLYLDYFFGEWDHIAHLANDDASHLEALDKLDTLVGRIWTAIEESPLARDTALVLVSDHGMNSDPAIYRQGYSLINFFGSATGGGHHVMTNRHPESEYKLKGLDPFVSQVVTPSRESFYLRDQSQDYPTAFLDLDGNERASVYLRNSDINAIQILMSQPETAPAIARIIDEHRADWSGTAAELDAELAALGRAIDRHRAGLPARPGPDVTEWKRRKTAIETWEHQFHGYTEYRRWLTTTLSLSTTDIATGKLRIPKRTALDRNSIYQLQNYVIGAPNAYTLTRVNYFKLLTGIRVRNNVQPGVDPRPIDFVAVPVSAAALKPALAADEWPDSDAIWLYKSADRQALILPRRNSRSLRYLPVRNLRQDAEGRITFEPSEWTASLPLDYFEDPALDVAGERAAWLNAWHTEQDWLRATNGTRYSNAIISVAQQFAPIELGDCASLWEGAGDDQALLRRFALRLRNAVEPDMLILANDHWNFNVRGFNPGGNHGSFFRISTHSVLMIAGGGVPAGMAIDRPYDSLSFVPTLLALTNRGNPAAFPGPIIEELLPPRSPPTRHPSAAFRSTSIPAVRQTP